MKWQHTGAARWEPPGRVRGEDSGQAQRVLGQNSGQAQRVPPEQLLHQNRRHAQGENPGQVLRENGSAGPWSTRFAPGPPPSVLPAGRPRADTAAFSIQQEYLADRNVLGPLAALTAPRREYSSAGAAPVDGQVALTRLLAAQIERTVRREALLAEASPWILPGMAAPPQQPFHGVEETGTPMEYAAPAMQGPALPWLPSWLAPGGGVRVEQSDRGGSAPRNPPEGPSRRAAQAPVPNRSEHGRKAPTLTSHDLHLAGSEPSPRGARDPVAPGAAETSTPALNRAFPQPSPALSPLAEQIAEITPERFRELLAQVLEDDALRHGLNLKEG